MNEKRPRSGCCQGEFPLPGGRLALGWWGWDSALQNLWEGRRTTCRLSGGWVGALHGVFSWQRQDGCKGPWHNCDVGFLPPTLTKHFGYTQYQIWEFTTGSGGWGGGGCWETEHKQVIRVTCAHDVPMLLLFGAQGMNTD